MVKITVRRIALAAAALVLSLLSLLALCFPVLRMDISSAAGSIGSVGDVLDAYGLGAVSENGFAFLDGRSGIILAFEQFIEGFVSSANISFRLTDLSGLEIFSQIFNILLLVISAVLIILTICWFFGMRSESAVRTVSLVAAWVAVVYMVEGLVGSLILEAQWSEAVERAAGASSIFYGRMFSTLAYVPLILIAVFEFAFWAVVALVRDKPAEEGAAEAEPAAAERGEEGFFDRLRKLKALYDDGILTEQEFVAEKAKILSGEK